MIIVEYHHAVVLYVPHSPHKSFYVSATRSEGSHQAPSMIVGCRCLIASPTAPRQASRPKQSERASLRIFLSNRSKPSIPHRPATTLGHAAVRRRGRPPRLALTWWRRMGAGACAGPKKKNHSHSFHGSRFFTDRNLKFPAV